jgi:hypothetical protein
MLAKQIKRCNSIAESIKAGSNSSTGRVKQLGDPCKIRHKVSYGPTDGVSNFFSVDLLVQGQGQTSDNRVREDKRAGRSSSWMSQSSVESLSKHRAKEPEVISILNKVIHDQISEV